MVEAAARQTEQQDSKSESSSSVASSFAARKFLECACDDYDSSVQDDPEEDAPACDSLNIRSAGDNDSESSISSVASSAIEGRMSRN